LEDRFGKIPPEGMELMRIVPLRRMGKRLGIEKVVLKVGRMTLFMVGNEESPYYQSAAFGKLIAYMGQHPRDCNLREQNGKRSMVIKNVETVETALAILKEISEMEAV
jgi:transcription-repair coupling factor (superfamily II helicase)